MNNLHAKQQAAKKEVIRKLRDLLGLQDDTPLPSLPHSPEDANATFVIETGTTSICFSGIDDILDQNRFRHRILAATGVEMPQFTNAEWGVVVRSILAATETIG